MNDITIGGRCYDETRNCVAKRLGISLPTLARYIKIGKLPQPFVVGNKHYFDSKEVDEFIIRQQSAEHRIATAHRIEDKLRIAVETHLEIKPQTTARNFVDVEDRIRNKDQSKNQYGNAV